MLEFDGTRKGRRRGALIALAFFIAALALYLLPAPYHDPIREAIRRSVLRPFVVAQSRIDVQRVTRRDLAHVRAQRDSLLAVTSAQAALAEENRQLRAALSLRTRAEDRFVAGQVLRVGLESAAGTFLVDAGSRDGVMVGSPVVAADGLLGVVVGVDPTAAQAIDWSHGEFRVSVMTADGVAYGIAEPRRGRFREEDLLVLAGAPFHSDIARGTLVVTSGRSQLYPRGIPVGTVIGIEEADTGWRKTYLVQPSVRPESVRHVLIGVGAQGGDVSALWQTVPAAPSVDAPAPRGRGPAEPRGGAG